MGVAKKGYEIPPPFIETNLHKKLAGKSLNSYDCSLSLSLSLTYFSSDGKYTQLLWALFDICSNISVLVHISLHLSRVL